MKNKSRKNIIIILLVAVIAVLSTLLLLSLTGGLKSESENNGTTNDDVQDGEISTGENNNAEKYEEYNKFDEVTLSNGSKWIVIKDSNQNTDYVTLLSKESFVLTEQDNGNNGEYFVKVSNDEAAQFNKEMYELKVIYNNCILKKILEDRVVNNIPVNLKEVDGYKIRLITLDELFSLDNNWSYDEQSDTYNYTGNNLEQYLNSILTMSYAKITEGRRGSLYKSYMVSTEPNSGINPYSIIGPFPTITSLYDSIKPAINVYKSELK